MAEKFAKNALLAYRVSTEATTRGDLHEISASQLKVDSGALSAGTHRNDRPEVPRRSSPEMGKVPRDIKLLIIDGKKLYADFQKKEGCSRTVTGGVCKRGTIQ